VLTVQCVVKPHVCLCEWLVGYPRVCVCVCVCVCVSAVGCAMSVVEMVVRNFASLIKTTVSGPPPSSVDIAAEERSCWFISFINGSLHCVPIK